MRQLYLKLTILKKGVNMRLQSTVYQVQEVMQMVNQIGESKHSAKEEFKSNYNGSQQIDKFMASFAKESGIYSIQTFKDYLTINVDLAKFAKENFNTKDIQNLTAEHVKAYLQEKVKTGLAKSSIQKYSAALEKFETALSIKYGKEFNFDVKNALSDSQKGSLKISERAGYHPYENTKAIVDNISKNPNIPDSHKLAIRITQETGLRLHKAIVSAGIKSNLDGSISTISKGGRVKELNLSESLKNELRTYLNGKTVFKLDDKNYKQILSELKTAAKNTGQDYQALHGFRHSFFLDKSNDLQLAGMSLKESWDLVSKTDMDHNRFVSNYTRG